MSVVAAISAAVAAVLSPAVVANVSAAAEHEFLESDNIARRAAQLGSKCGEANKRHVRPPAWQTPAHLHGRHEHAAGELIGR